MSVYIKWLNLPKEGCTKIILCADGTVWGYGERPDNYEAIELPPHGRLGDLDAFAAEMKERQIEAGKWLKEAKDHDTAVRADAVLSFLCEVKLTLDKTPTIIPAEPEKEDT